MMEQTIIDYLNKNHTTTPLDVIHSSIVSLHAMSFITTKPNRALAVRKITMNKIDREVIDTLLKRFIKPTQELSYKNRRLENHADIIALSVECLEMLEVADTVYPKISIAEDIHTRSCLDGKSAPSTTKKRTYLNPGTPSFHKATNLLRCYAYNAGPLTKSKGPFSVNQKVAIEFLDKEITRVANIIGNKGLPVAIAQLRVLGTLSQVSIELRKYRANEDHEGWYAIAQEELDHVLSNTSVFTSMAHKQASRLISLLHVINSNTRINAVNLKVPADTEDDVSEDTPTV